MRHLITLTTTLAVCGILITACDDNAKHDNAPANSGATTSGTPAAGSAASSPTTPSASPGPVQGSPAERDQKLETAIHNRLEGDKDISNAGKMVSVIANNGVVVLTGVVHNEGDHQKIVALVHQVEGVQRVDDHITVQ